MNHAYIVNGELICADCIDYGDFTGATVKRVQARPGQYCVECDLPLGEVLDSHNGRIMWESDAYDSDPSIRAILEAETARHDVQAWE